MSAYNKLIPNITLHNPTPPYTIIHHSTHTLHTPYTTIYHPTHPYTTIHHSTHILHTIHTPYTHPTLHYISLHHPTHTLHHPTQPYTHPTLYYTSLYHPTPSYTTLHIPYSTTMDIKSLQIPQVVCVYVCIIDNGGYIYDILHCYLHTYNS